MEKNLFYYRPRPGDVWEFKTPNKPKKVKRIDYVAFEWCSCRNGSDVRRPFVWWCRAPKGRYTRIRVKGLLKYGRLVSRGGIKEDKGRARLAQLESDESP